MVIEKWQGVVDGMQGFIQDFLLGGERMARLRTEKFKVPHPLLRAMLVPCPPCFDGAILTLRLVLQAFKLLGLPN